MIPITKAEILKQYPAIGKLTTYDVDPTANVTGGNLFGSTNEYLFSGEANSYMVPSKVRMRTRIEIKHKTDGEFKDDKNVGIGFNAGASLVRKEEIFASKTVMLENNVEYSTLISIAGKRINNLYSETEVNEQCLEVSNDRRIEQLIGYKTVNRLSEGKINGIKYTAISGVTPAKWFIKNYKDIDVTGTYAGKHLRLNSVGLGSLKEIEFKLNTDGVTYNAYVYGTNTLIVPAAEFDEALSIGMELVVDNTIKTLKGDGIYDLYFKPTLAFFDITYPVYLGNQGFRYRLMGQTSTIVRENIIQSYNNPIDISDITLDVKSCVMEMNKFSGSVSDGRTAYDGTTKNVTDRNLHSWGRQTQSISIDEKTSGLFIAFRRKKKDNQSSSSIFDNLTGDVRKNLKFLQCKIGSTLFPELGYNFGTGDNEVSLRKLWKDNNMELNNYVGEYNEKYEEFLEKGAFMYVNVGDAANKNTTLTVQFEFENGTNDLDLIVIQYTNTVFEIMKKENKTTVKRSVI